MTVGDVARSPEPSLAATNRVAPVRVATGFSIGHTQGTSDNGNADFGFFNLGDYDLSGSFTVTIDFTPDNIGVTSMRYAWQGGPWGHDGWLIEEVVPSFGGFTAVCCSESTFHGTVPYAGFGADNETAIAGRQQYTLVIDRATDLFRTYRNGAALSPSLSDISTLADPTAAGYPLIVGPGQTVHNIVFHDRALTAAEVAGLHFILQEGAMSDTLDVLTLAEGKLAVGIGDADTSKDALLAQKITSVSRRLDQACGPIVRRTITGEVLEGGADSAWVRFAPVSSWTSVTEYDATVAQVLDPEDYDTQPDYAYVAEPWTTSTATYSGRLWRRSAGGALTFPVGPQAVRVTYVAGRFATTSAVDPLFKDAASVMLKNAWRPFEAAVQGLGEFDVPAQNFPRFGVPNYVRDMLADEWLSAPVVA